MGTVPRLEMSDFPPFLAERLEPRVRRLGYLGEFFKCAAHQPKALAAFNDFTEASKAGLPERLVEVVALTCAGWMGNDYERNQHERLCVRLGFGRDWVAAVNRLEMDPSLSPEERAVQDVVLAVLNSRGHEARSQFDSLVDLLGPDAAIAVLMTVGRYVTHGLFVNTLGLAPPVPSIFEDGFVG